MAAAARRARSAGPLGVAVVALGLAGIVLLILAELSPVLEIEVGGGSCALADPALAETCAPTGAQRHSWSLGLLGVLGLVMAWGAGIGGSRPAALALLAAGAAGLAIVLIGDLPAVNETGQIGVAFEDAAATPASGFWLSLAGGAVVVGAGTLALLSRRR